MKFDLVEGQIIPLESLAMHVDVVEPVMMLLTRERRFEKVNEAFRAALSEIADGDPADAITDAGTALQEILTEPHKEALRCLKRRLSDLVYRQLLADARRRSATSRLRPRRWWMRTATSCPSGCHVRR